MPYCPFCHAQADRRDHHCRVCGRSFADVELDSAIPVRERPIGELPRLIVKGLGILIAGIFILVITMADIGVLRPVIERTHQYIPFVNDPACVDIFTWYERIEDDRASLDRELDLLYSKEIPSNADIDLAINGLEKHRKFLIDSNPPDEVIPLRSMFVESTDLMISSMKALKDRDPEAVIGFLDEGDRVLASIDEESDRINAMCGWDDDTAIDSKAPVFLISADAAHVSSARRD